MISRALNVLPRSRSSTSSAFWYSLRLTVNEKSVCPDAPMFCTIMSTSMLASAIGPRIAYAMPGRSGDAHHGDLGLVAVERDAGDDRLFHVLVFLEGDERAR